MQFGVDLLLGTANKQKLNISPFCLYSIRKIKEYDSDFSTKTFAERAQEIFIEAHNALTQ